MTHAQEIFLTNIVQQKTKKYAPTLDDILLNLVEIEQVIKNYCAIECVPDALLFIWANMAVDLFSYEYTVNTEPDDILDIFDPSDVGTLFTVHS